MGIHSSSGQIVPAVFAGADLDRLQTAKTVVGVAVPYLAVGLHRLQFAAVNGAGANFVDDRGRVFLDMELSSNTDEHLPAIILAALWRFLRSHSERRRLWGADEKLWAVASVAAVQADTTLCIKGSSGQARYTLPEPVITAEQFGCLPNDPVEDIYGAILDEVLNDPTAPQEGGSGSDGSDGSDGADGADGSDGADGADGSDGADGDSGSGGSDGDSGSDGSDGDSGSGGSDGDSGSDNSGGSDGYRGHNPILRPATDELSRAADEFLSGLSDVDQEATRRMAAEDTQRYQNSGRGNALPESVTEWSAAVLAPPKLDPRDILRRDFGREVDAARSGREPTHKRRSRRQGAMGSKVLLPGRALVVVNVSVGLDVSGSMTDAELVQAVSEVANVAMERGVQVEYFSVSTMPHPPRQLEAGGRVIVDRDHAGTDMRVAYDWWDTQGTVVRVLITDGETPWPVPEVVPAGTHNVVAITATDRDYYEELSARMVAVNPRLIPMWLPVSMDGYGGSGHPRY